MQIRTLALLSSLFALAACATNPPEVDSKDQASSDMECVTETPIGSLMPKKVCRQKLTPEDRMRIQDEMGQRARPTGTGPKG